MSSDKGGLGHYMLSLGIAAAMWAGVVVAADAAKNKGMPVEHPVEDTIERRVEVNGIMRPLRPLCQTFPGGASAFNAAILTGCELSDLVEYNENIAAADSWIQPGTQVCCPYSRPELPVEIWANFSHYNPLSKGVNCNENCENVARGDQIIKDGKPHGRLWWNPNSRTAGVACAREFELGTKVYVPPYDIHFLCVDRGSMIICAKGVCIFDVLGYGFPHLDGKPIESTYVRLEK